MPAVTLGVVVPAATAVAKLGPVAMDVALQHDKESDELRESKSKITQMYEALKAYNAEGYSVAQLQPLIDATERLARAYKEADEARAAHEKNKADIGSFRIPSCMGMSASAWVLGTYADPLSELRDAVNKELKIVQGMRPHRVPASSASAATPAMQCVEEKLPDAYKVGDTILVWSPPERGWFTGLVARIEGVLLDVDYVLATGERKARRLPKGSDHVCSPQPFAPAPPRGCQVGEAVETFSLSQGAWCKGLVHGINNTNVEIEYMGPDGGAYKKQVPVGHEHIRRCGPSSLAVGVRADRCRVTGRMCNKKKTLQRSSCRARF